MGLNTAASKAVSDSQGSERKSGVEPHGSTSSADVLLVGAGLANGLLAWLLRSKRPELKVVVLEAASSIPSTRTWSFHGFDLGENFEAIRPLVFKEWNGYEVRFKSFTRKFGGKYASLRPRDLQRGLASALGENLRFDCRVKRIAADEVELASGEILKARCVIDGRGVAPIDQVKIAYQKFVGADLKLEEPHGLTRPILMDATVEQEGGYRFVYVLPWSDTELLIEDTRYSTEKEIEREHYLSEISGYARRQGWKIAQIQSVESGCLPLPLRQLPKRDSEIPSVGMSGGLFHPVTGYSLPDAVRVAAMICALPVLDTASVASAIGTYRAGRSADWKFFLLLNKLMFEVAEPTERFRIFEHFYSLPERLIERFYQGMPKWQDKIRVFSGKPPVPITNVVKSLRQVFA